MKRAASSSARAVIEPPKPWRRRLVLGVLGLGTLAMVGKAVDIQLIRADRFAERGDDQSLRIETIRAHRGAVVDRHGQPLALSAPVDAVIADPAEVLDGGDAAVQTLAKALGQPAPRLRKTLTQQRRRHELAYPDAARRGPQKIYLKSDLPPEDAARIAALGVPGVGLERDYRRYYPAAEIAVHVVGTLNFEGHPVSGVERTRDVALSGSPGRRRLRKDNRRRVVDDPEELLPAVPGAEVALTLDLRLQYLAYRELKAAVAEHRAKGGLVVLADARNGDILALASQPSFNPNQGGARDAEAARNRAVSMTFEPGSTVKPLLVAQALEAQVITPDYQADTGNGFLRISNVSVHDVHAEGLIDLPTLLAKSSNVGAVMIGQKLGAERMWAGYDKFGFGERTGVGLPFEQATILREPQRWRASDTVTASYGYSFTATALHLVRAYAAIANDGLMPALHIIEPESPVPPARVVSAQTARYVRRMLEGVTVAGGTGMRAAVPGYRVAGKTGTVKKNGPGGYLKGVYQSAFIGMLPAQAPQLVALVMIDEPSAGAYYGGAVSAPVFSRVMAGAARLLQIKPDAAPDALPDGGTRVARAQP